MTAKMRPQCRSVSRSHVRGATLAEYIILVGVVALAALIGFEAFGNSTREAAITQGRCVSAMACNEGGSFPSSSIEPGSGQSGSQSGGRARAGSAAYSFGKGLIVDGVWGMVKGLGELGYGLVVHPVATTTGIAKGIAYTATHPREVGGAIWEGVKHAWDEDPARAVGNAIVQLATAPFPVSKVGAVTKAAAVAEKAAAVAANAEKAAAVAANAETAAAAAQKVATAAGGAEKAAPAAAGAEKAAVGAAAAGRTTGPRTAWNAEWRASTRNTRTLEAFEQGSKGKSVKDLDLSGKSASEIDRELRAKGFTHERTGIATTDANGNTVYRTKDRGLTSNPKDPNATPQDIYVHPDGGMVRVKPAGDPGNPYRAQPHASKSVLYNPTKGTSFSNEAFKVTNDGRAVPKAPTPGAGLPTTADEAARRKIADELMNAGHTNLPGGKP